MKIILFTVLLLSLNGCTLVSCNHTFPKLDWYWSKAAIECRKEHQQDKQYNSTLSNTNR